MKKPDGLTETEWLQYQSWAEELTATWPHMNIWYLFFIKAETDKQVEADKAERDWYNKAWTKNHSKFSQTPQSHSLIKDEVTVPWLQLLGFSCFFLELSLFQEPPSPKDEEVPLNPTRPEGPEEEFEEAGTWSWYFLIGMSVAIVSGERRISS